MVYSDTCESVPAVGTEQRLLASPAAVGLQCVHVCVCVREREGGRERMGERWREMERDGDRGKRERGRGFSHV